MCYFKKASLFNEYKVEIIVFLAFYEKSLLLVWQNLIFHRIF